MDYKSVFTNLCLELQQNRSWIKGLGKNPFTHSLTAVLFVRGAPKRVPSDSEKHRHVYTSSNVCHSHEWRVDTASGKTLKKRNACLHAVRQAVEKKIACIYCLQSEGVKVWAAFTDILLIVNYFVSLRGKKHGDYYMKTITNYSAGWVVRLLDYSRALLALPALLYCCKSLNTVHCTLCLFRTKLKMKHETGNKNKIKVVKLFYEHEMKVINN